MDHDAVYEEIYDRLEEINDHVQAIWRLIGQLRKHSPGKPAGPIVRPSTERHHDEGDQ